MRRNKAIALLLIVVMAFLLVACGQTKEPEKTKSEETTVSTEQSSTSTTTATTTTTQPLAVNPDDFTREQFKNAVFEIPKSWKKQVDGNYKYFYEKRIGSAPFIMFNFQMLDFNVEDFPDEVDMFWTSLISAVGANEYKLTTTSHHEFARFDYIQNNDGKDYIVNCASTIAKSDVYSIAMLCEKNDPDKIRYDSIFEYVVDSFLIEKISTPTTTTTTKITEPEIESYPPGQYKVGSDVPAGLYYLTSYDGRGYFSVTSDANGDNILFNDNFGFLAYVEIRDGEYIEVYHAELFDATKYQPILSDDLSELENGMYRVGHDIPAGEYKLKSPEDRSAYYAIIDARHDIKSNKNFDGTAYVTVNKGDYLYLYRAQIISAP